MLPLKIVHLLLEVRSALLGRLVVLWTLGSVQPMAASVLGPRLYPRDPQQRLGSATHGFAWAHVPAERLTLRFYNVQPTVLYAWEMARPAP